MPCDTRQLTKVKISNISKWLLFDALKKMKRNPEWGNNKNDIEFIGGTYSGSTKTLTLNDEDDAALIKKYVTLSAVQMNAPKFGWKVTVDKKSPWKFSLSPRGSMRAGFGGGEATSKYGGYWW